MASTIRDRSSVEGTLAKKKKQQESRGTHLDRLAEIKKLVVIAMFSDDELMERLVLKGGNALDLIHQISMRASVDVDFSMQDDFPAGGLETFRNRVQKVLEDTFRDVGLAVFDVKMEERPEGLTADVADFWGGYRIEFKLIGKKQFEEFKADVNELRRHALMLGQGQKFLIDISRFEYVSGKLSHELDGYQVFVYSPEMIVCEKLRAICQQMPEYGPVVKRNRPGGARARDFLDIYTLVTELDLDLTFVKNQELLATIFEAKRVPLRLLGRIKEYREFHREDFIAVRATVKAGVQLKDFDEYFDFVLGLVDPLESLWNE